ncbi:hypothetical protein B0H10DRAFT_1942100 [Mycena sp. CBHHK59/15]|nr:hypothetical protein B0H10DRAFT_1942100 [Mycena sp. CBHHK59/15]
MAAGALYHSELPRSEIHLELLLLSNIGERQLVPCTILSCLVQYWRTAAGALYHSELPRSEIHTLAQERPLSNWKRAFMGLPAATGAGADAVKEDTGKTMGIANLRGCQGHAHGDPQKAREFHPRAIQIAFVLREFGSQGHEEHLPWAGDRRGEGGGTGSRAGAQAWSGRIEYGLQILVIFQGKPPRDRIASRQRDIRRPNGVKLYEPTRETEALRTSLELCLPASNGLPFEAQLNKASVPTAELKKQENEKYLPSQQGLQAS